MKKGLRILLAALSLCLAARGGQAEQAGAVERALGAMSLREKVGQLFIVRPDALDASYTLEEVADSSASGVTAMTEGIAQALRQYPVGGIALFGKNLEGPEQLKRLTDDFQAAAQTGLFICIDEEGGSVARFANSGLFDVPKTKSMQVIGLSGDPEKAREAGRTIGAYLREYGINVDFAPVADVNTNPQNIVIGARAFGNNPERVAAMVAACVEGFGETGIIPCLKHFPGHGDTRGDSHDGYVGVDKTWEEMLACEMLPFQAGIAAGADLVMAAHVTAVNVTADGLPASLSAGMIDGKLRGELGFAGVVVTDAMAMGAIAGNYTSGESALLALKAGVDLILMPYDFQEAYDAVLSAVEAGEISAQRLDESVRRILTLKEKYGLLARAGGA